MALKYYYDFMSQPSRALYIFLKISEVPFKNCPVNLKNGEHLTEEFEKNLSRFQKVPFIHDGDFKLNESIAILRYICGKYGIYNRWYPKDIKEQARVDEYLEWQHNNTRTLCALYFIKSWLIPKMTGEEADPELIEGYKGRMEACLGQIESLWLKSGQNRYITGDGITIADVFAACEIEQITMAGYDPRKDRPVLGAWMDRVRAETNPYYDESHQIVRKIASLSKSKM